RLVIVFDEIERILPVGTGSALPRCAEFFGYLRALTQRTGALSVIVVGANPWLFEQARWEGRDNPVFQFARELYMPPLTREDCSVMISSLGRGTGVSYTEDALDRIYAATGGHP